MADIDFRSEIAGSSSKNSSAGSKTLYIGLSALVIMGFLAYIGYGTVKLNSINRSIAKCEEYMAIPENVELVIKANQVTVKNGLLSQYNEQIQMLQTVMNTKKLIKEKLVQEITDLLPDETRLRKVKLENDRIELDVVAMSEREIVEYTYRLQEYQGVSGVQVSKLAKPENESIYPFEFSITCNIVQEELLIKKDVQGNEQ